MLPSLHSRSLLYHLRLLSRKQWKCKPSCFFFSFFICLFCRVERFFPLEFSFQCNCFKNHLFACCFWSNPFFIRSRRCHLAGWRFERLPFLIIHLCISISKMGLQLKWNFHFYYKCFRRVYVFQQRTQWCTVVDVIVCILFSFSALLHFSKHNHSFKCSEIFALF